jgi:hypothetical protein
MGTERRVAGGVRGTLKLGEKARHDFVGGEEEGHDRIPSPWRRLTAQCPQARRLEAGELSVTVPGAATLCAAMGKKSAVA